MTIPQALQLRGFKINGRKAQCPFHDDNNPSAIINANGIYCFSCARSYSYQDISKKLGVQIEYNAKEEEFKEKCVKDKEILFIY